MNARVAAVALVAAAAPACGNGVATAPLNVIYAVTVSKCASDCKVITASDVTTATRGDTVAMVVSVSDTVTDDSALVLVRGYCDTGLQLVKGRTIVRSWPSPVTCPDSVISKYVAPARSDARAFVWVVDTALVPGGYRLDAHVLITPGLGASVSLQVN